MRSDIRVLQDRLATEPEVPADKGIKSEEDMEYHDWCPFERWQSAKGSLLIKTVIQSHGLFHPPFFAVKNIQFSFWFLIILCTFANGI